MPDHAVIIGISKYPRLRDLDGPENDAQNFEAWLVDPAGGNVAPANILRVNTAGFAPNASRPNISDLDDAFQTLIDRADLAAAPLGERLYLFMAGHGVAPEAGDAALLPANASLGRVSDQVSAHHYAANIADKGMFRQVFTVADCCRDDWGIVQPRRFPFNIRQYGPPGRRFNAFAVRYGAAAREGQIQGTCRGYFTTAVIDALWHARRDGAGLTADRFAAHVYNFISAARTCFSVVLDDPDFQVPPNFVVTSTPARGPVSVQFTFGHGDPAHAVQVKEDDAVIHTRVGTDTPWIVPLEPGIYTVEVPAQALRKPIQAFNIVGQQHNVI